MNDLKRLTGLIGKEFNVDDIICEMIDQEEPVMVSKVEGHTSNFEGHGECQLWEVSYDMEETDTCCVWVDQDNIIVEVK